MSDDELLRTIHVEAIMPAFALLPEPMNTPRALVQLLTTGLQESRLKHRRQLVGTPPKPVGPAKGLWQFERGGGCKGVIEHQASRYWMARVCEARGVAFTPTALWNGIEVDDVLAAATARLLYFTDPKKLPDVDDEAGGWNLYIRTWRPGKPHRATWPAFHQQAREYVAALATEHP